MNRQGATRKRPYRMTARAAASAETGKRILDATQAALSERAVEEITLASIADRAGVSVQTILERFQSKSGLFEATLSHIAEGVTAQRGAAPAGDPQTAARVLIQHYEELGDAVVRMLAEEIRNPGVVGALARGGREYHREWCERVFAPALKGLRGVERDRRLAQLMTVTDVYAWKVLRRDRGLSLRQAELAMSELIEALMETRA